MVMASATGAPVSVPSKGVAVQATVCPPTNPPSRVAPVPASTPSMVQERMVSSASPSASA